MFPRLLPLTPHERKLKARNGIVEEGLLEHIFTVITPRTRFAIEFGAGNGVEWTLVRRLIEQGWSALLIEGDERKAQALEASYAGDPRVTAIRSFVTAENIEGLFAAGRVPPAPDLLCIDVDGIDYWLWRAIRSYRPRVVCIEYNASYGPTAEFTVPYEPDFGWNGDDFMGASFATLCGLAAAKGYSLIHATSDGDNLIFVTAEEADRFPRLPAVSDYFQWPQYGRRGRAPNGKGHPASVRNSTGLQRLAWAGRYYAMALPRKFVKLLQPYRLESARRGSSTSR